MIESVAAALAESQDIDVEFCAPDSLQMLNQSVDYLRTVDTMQSAAIPYPPVARSLYCLQKSVIMQTQTFFGNSYITKALRRMQHMTSSLLQPLCNQIDPPSLSAADVYHSTWSRLPKQVEANSRVKKIITVYDRMHLDMIAPLQPDVWPLCISTSTKNDLCSQTGIDPERVTVALLAADRRKFYRCTDSNKISDVLSKYGIGDTPYILSVNTLVPRKNMEHAIRCFLRVVEEQKLPELKFVLVGANAANHAALAAIARMPRSAQNQVILPGFIPDEDLSPIYSGATAFVYPSLYEGFGLPPLEAMQCGTPVITSNTSSLPEVVGDAGIMVDPTNSDELCSAILKVYFQSGLRETMRTRSLQRANLFSWKKCADQIAALYSKVVAI